jgi:hypothetical protein
MQNLTQLGWEISYTNSNNVHLRGLNTDFWRTASEMAMQLRIEGFIDTLAVVGLY